MVPITLFTLICTYCHKKLLIPECLSHPHTFKEDQLKINLSRIFRDPLVKAAFPNTYAYFDTPTVYTLANLIISKLF